MCPSGYNHSGFMATPELKRRMYMLWSGLHFCRPTVKKFDSYIAVATGFTYA